MVESHKLQLSLDELSQATQLPSEMIVEIVEQGIVDPFGNSPDNWTFSMQTIAVAKKAFRLHQDLEIDWPGIALAISLIEELDQLREENRQLHDKLKLFTSM